MWVAVLLIALGILYWASPYDALPDFILGWGWIDDLLAIWFLWQIWRRFRAARMKAGQASPGPDADAGDSAGSDHLGSDRRGSRDEAPKSPHEVLGVAPTASPDEIRQAYRRLANQYHPDKVSHLGTEFQELAEKRFKEIQAAYDMLTARR